MVRSHSLAGVGGLVRELRAVAGLTLEQLAAAIGCSKAQLSLMESGQRTITPQWARKLEKALAIPDRRIVAALQWQNVPPAISAEVATSRSQSQVLANRLRRALASADPLSELRDIVQQTESNIAPPTSLRTLAAQSASGVGGRGIPVINKVAAGYPTEFTDLDYPRTIADDYIVCPDITDPDAFAARVVGDSMEPEYHEGDIVIFSPQLPTPSGADCFVRLERDNQTTLKRIYFEDEGSNNESPSGMIRLQPLNNAYAPRIVHREEVNGMYAAAYVMRKVKA